MNGSILIPTSFRLKGKKIRVIINDDYCKEGKLWGEADFIGNIITLCHRTHKGNVLKKSLKEKTFYHELVHHILSAMEEEELMYNEDFVEKFACLLYQYEKTKQ